MATVRLSVYARPPPMAHQFSVEIHDFLTSKLEAAEQMALGADAKGEPDQSAYFQGRIQELKHIRQLLSAKYDLRFHKYFDSDTAGERPEERASIGFQSHVSQKR